MTAIATARVDAEMRALAALADYEGWAAWVDDGGDDPTLVLEARPATLGMAQVLGPPSAYDAATRPTARDVLDWNDLPKTRIVRLALFAFRGHYTEQPVAVVERQPGADGLRFLQFKARGVVAHAVAVHRDRTPPVGELPHGQNRTPPLAHYVGYWDPRRGPHGESLLVCVTRFGRKHRKALHPCWPKPHGFALSPHVVGLRPGDVPPCPFPALPAAAEAWTPV